MTKEQALQNELTGTTAEVDTYPNILRAMDAYARQEAIEFGKFIDEKQFYREGELWYQSNPHGDSPLTDDQLYDLYLTHKNKSDVKS